MKITTKTRNAVIASLIIMMFAATMAVPIVVNEQKAASQEQGYEYEYGYDNDEMLSADPYDIVMGLAPPPIGLIMAFYKDSVPKDPKADVNDEVKAFARGVELKRTQEKIVLVSQLGTGLVENDRQILQLSGMHMNRAMEIAAAKTWYQDATFYSDKLLLYSGVMKILAQTNTNTQYALNWAYHNASNDIFQLRTEKINYAPGLQIGLVWAGGSTAPADDNLDLIFSTIVTAETGTAEFGKNMVYLDTDSQKENNPSDPIIIYAFQNGSIVNPLTGGSIPLIRGANVIYPSLIPSGFYWLTGGVYAGPFLNSTEPGRGATTEGGAVIDCDGTIGYIKVDGSNLKITYGTYATQTSPYIRYVTSADGKIVYTDGEWNSSPEYVANMIKTYAKYYGEVKNRINTSVNAGWTMWTISAVAKESNILLSPSSVMPYLEDFEIDPIVSYAMYVNALEQIASFYENRGTILKAADIQISAESLKLFCYGNIYAPDGKVLYSNVVFTPYTYLQDFYVTKYGSNIYTQPGMIMIWDKDATTADGWKGSNTNKVTSLVVDTRISFEAKEMYYEMKPVDSITLRVMTVHGLGIFPNIKIGMTDTPTLLSATALFMVIFILLGLCIILLGLPIRIPSPFVVLIGIIVIIVGVLFAGPLASFILGLGWLT